MEVSTAISIIALLVKEEPAIEGALRNIFTKAESTPVDWQSEIDALRSDSYKKLVPDSKLPQEELDKPSAP